MEIFITIVVCMAILAVIDLSVGVANDAVNFTNSAIGSKAASRTVILIICAIGIVFGSLTSAGMMEVTRKGLFNPQMFTLNEVFIVFLAVMITDILLLDFYNTMGLPTSTTVSLVFEILGASFVLALLKSADLQTAFQHINSSGALKIISGIGFSIIVAFVCGALLQFLFRFIFSFKVHKTVKIYGGVFSGLAITSIVFFVTISGLKSSDVIPPAATEFVEKHFGLLMLGSFVFFSLLFQLLIYLKVHVFKIIILCGTGALAMAFAGNDLVNFIGVPLAALTTFEAISANGGDSSPMATVLTAAVEADKLILVGTAVVMVVTLWFSKKAQTVTKTEIGLSSSNEGHDGFAPNPAARVFVRGFINFIELVKKILPQFLIYYVNRRFIRNKKDPNSKWVAYNSNFDYLRASSNILIASALIMIGTLFKLPLSTTFVTFMVAMGTSLSDRAWGREVAVNRVSGVLTVIGGWFLTAIIASVAAGIAALLIYSFGLIFGVVLFIIALVLLVFMSKVHKKKGIKEQLQIEDLERYRKDPASFITKALKNTHENFNSMSKALHKCIENLESGKSKHLRELKQILSGMVKHYEATQQMVYSLSNQNQNINTKNIILLHGISNIFGAIRHTIGITARLRDNILLLSETYYAKLAKSEYEEMADLLKTFDEQVETLKEILKNDRHVPKDSDVKELAKTRRSIHQKQMQRIQSGKRKAKISITYLTLIDDMVALNESMYKLLNEISIHRRNVL